MSFIRPLEDLRWVQGENDGLYVYSDGGHIMYLPRKHDEFIEVVMRMLEQSDELSDDELLTVQQAFANRLHMDDDVLTNPFD